MPPPRFKFSNMSITALGRLLRTGLIPPGHSLVSHACLALSQTARLQRGDLGSGVNPSSVAGKQLSNLARWLDSNARNTAAGCYGRTYIFLALSACPVLLVTYILRIGASALLSTNRLWLFLLATLSQKRQLMSSWRNRGSTL